MIKNLFNNHLNKNTTKLVLAVIFWLLLSLESFNCLASNIVIDSTTNQQQELSLTGQNLKITDSGSIEKSGTGVLVNVGSAKTWSIDINSAADKGIITTSNAITTTASFNESSGTININSGTVTTSGRSATILNYAASINTSLSINLNSSNATISNTSLNGAAAIQFTGTNLSIENSGTISGARGIVVSGLTTNSLSDQNVFTLKNNSTGVIKANNVNDSSYQTYAISIARVGKSAQITNEGSILGDIFFGREFLLNNSGNIVGNIEWSESNSSKTSIINTGNIVGNIKLGTNSESSFLMNSGAFTGNLYSQNSNQKIDINSGSFTGSIFSLSGSTINLGNTDFNGDISSYDSTTKHGNTSININNDFTLKSSSTFGAIDKIKSINTAKNTTVNFNGSVTTSNLEIASGSTVNVSKDITASTTNVSGTLNFGNTLNNYAGNINLNSGSKLNVGNSSKKVIGDVNVNTGSTLKIGNAIHNIDGNLVVKEGATLGFSLTPSAQGKLLVAQAAFISSGVSLNIDLQSNYTYMPNGSSYVIVDGAAGSQINAIDSTKININGSKTNQFSILTFTTSVVGNDLLVNVIRKEPETVTKIPSSNSVYRAISDIGNNATGELRALQQFLDTASNPSAINSALSAITPQSVNNILTTSVRAVNESVIAVEGRLEASRIQNEESKSSDSQNSYNKGHIKSLRTTQNSTPENLDQLAFKQGSTGSKINLDIILKELYKQFNVNNRKDYGVWAQVFGSNAKQGNLGNNDGYNSKSLGLAFGYDRKISYSTRIGFSLSYANSDAKSSDKIKSTSADIYQINVYSGYVFDDYFLDMIGGFAWKEYNSNRSVEALHKNVLGDYSGQTYVAKAKAGFNTKILKEFTLTPEISTTYNHSTIGKYTESGFGNASQEVQKNSSDFLEARIGANLTYEIKNKNNVIIPKLNASYGYNFLNDRQTSVSNFVGQTAAINSTSSKLSPESVIFGGAIDIYKKSSVLTFEYGSERRDKYTSNYWMARARWEFILDE